MDEFEEYLLDKKEGQNLTDRLMKLYTELQNITDGKVLDLLPKELNLSSLLEHKSTEFEKGFLAGVKLMQMLIMK